MSGTVIQLTKAEIRDAEKAARELLKVVNEKIIGSTPIQSGKPKDHSKQPK